MAEEQSGFSFVDKRRVPQEESEPARPAPDSPSETADAKAHAAAEARAESATAAPAHPSPPADAGNDVIDDDDGYPAPPPGEMPRLSVRDRLLMSIDILHQGAWIALGLVADPATGVIERNLPDARAAIDAVAFLAGKVEAGLDEPTRRELQRVVSDLQVNFVRQSQMHGQQ